ncbi:hypothetical protein L917_10808 [Phytophthora nicotianae]|uniref:Uncharacterized protein n=1 Tax=Phytophthora nicotianae TaxID=4792 RepID=W2KZJ0_PHYNI|nr:hypothetical protein L917_10808 [Phytophthora nicotianae]
MATRDYDEDTVLVVLLEAVSAATIAATSSRLRADNENQLQF